MLHVISLGAGVQSSTMALMFAHGELKPMPDCAIFADTQDEPDAVYEWLEHLEGCLPFPIYRVTKGKLSGPATTVRTSKTGTKYLKPSLPVFIDGEISIGKGMRHCTADFKVDVITRKLRDIGGKERGVAQYIGISTDEAARMKPHKLPWIENKYPLCMEARMDRNDCIQWMVRNGYREPPRSACVYCPFHSDSEWKRLKTAEPHEFQKAVEFEIRLQSAYEQSDFRGKPYLHKSCVPISEAQFSDERQFDMFTNECEGMCGV